MWVAEYLQGRRYFKLDTGWGKGELETDIEGFILHGSGVFRKFKDFQIDILYPFYTLEEVRCQPLVTLWTKNEKPAKQKVFTTKRR